MTFKTREDYQWRDVASDEIFAGKNVVVISLPCAFTPTYSSAHVPRYNELVPLFKANGVDKRALHAGYRAADSFPQVFISGEHVGGADELEAWFQQCAAA